MIDLSKIKEDFSVLVKEAQPWTLTQFVMWLDLKLSEFKIKGYMVLDHNVKTKPKWLTDDVGSGEATPSPAPCPQCSKPKRDERQFYSDIHASPSELQYRTVTKSAQNQQESEDNIRGEIGVIDLSEGLVQNKSTSQVSPGVHSPQIQNVRQISQQDYHMTEGAKSKDSSRHHQTEVIDIDAPAQPPQKRRIVLPIVKTFHKTSTPISSARFPPKPKSKPRPVPPLMIGPVYTTTSSATMPTFSSTYTSQSNRTVPASRSYALGAPPAVTTTSYSSSTSLADFQNLENLITQAIQSTDSLSSQQSSTNIPSQKSDYNQPLQGQPRRGSQPDISSGVQSNILPISQTSFNTSNSVTISQSSFSSGEFDNNQHSQGSFGSDTKPRQLSFGSTDQNIFATNIPTSQAVPVALHANVDVINQESSSSSLPPAPSGFDQTDITEIKIESDPEDNDSDAVITDSSMTSLTSTSQQSISMDSLTSQPVPVQVRPVHSRASFSSEASGLPKPGLVDPETAKAYQMVELVAGSGVYVYEKNISQAFKVGTESQTGTYSGEKMARYLLNVFWSRKELVGSTLSKVGRGKKILNQQIIEAILDFCEKHGRHSRSKCKEASRNVVTSVEWKERQKVKKEKYRKEIFIKIIRDNQPQGNT